MKNNEKRIKSGIKYALIRATYHGHCRVSEEDLYKFVNSLLGVNEEEIENIFDYNYHLKNIDYIFERIGL